MIVTSHGGRVVKLIGDEVMFIASSADRACEATAELLRDLDGLGLPPGRAGVAWGTCLTRDGDYYGDRVNLAARLTELAEPGSALITSATYDALSREFPSRTGASLAAATQNSVRGLPEPVLAYLLRPNSEGV